VASVFDWDMTTLGDPLTDLGTLLNYWPEGDRAAEAVPGLERLGLPGRDEVVAHYASRVGLDLGRGDVAWYEAFGCWRTAIILQQLYVRHLRGESSDDRMAARGHQVTLIAERALALAETLTP
jgi:aminoglycoside phosphotransferase (APT) family kinase protein